MIDPFPCLVVAFKSVRVNQSQVFPKANPSTTLFVWLWDLELTYVWKHRDAITTYFALGKLLGFTTRILMFGFILKAMSLKIALNEIEV